MRAGILASLIVLCLVPRALAQDDAGRPWAYTKGLEEQFHDRESAAGKDATKIIEVARWCAANGLFHRLPALLAPLEKDPAVTDLLGFAAVDPKSPPTAQPPLADAARFTATARGLAVLSPLSNDKKKKLLLDKDRTLKPPKPTTYFDLISDLDTAQLDIHSKMLNEYFRGMKNKFRAYLQSNVDVAIFANRSDYMYFYHWVMGQTGENVLGFYLPAVRSLYFYDDPYNRDAIAVTARHECTHLLIDMSYGSAPLPRWLHEGMACYLAADGENAREPYTMMLLLELMSQLDKTAAPIEKLATIERSKFQYPHYAQSWALIYYLALGPRNELYQKFLATLRERVNAKTTDGDCAKIVKETLEEQMSGKFESLAKDCRAYFEKDFKISRPDQYGDLAESALVRFGFGPKESNQPKLVEIASLSLAAGRGGAAPSDLAALDYSVLLTTLRRTEISKPTYDAWRLTLRALVAGLKSLGALTDEAKIGQIVRFAFADVASGLGLQNKPGEPHDLIAQLRELAKKKQGREAEEVQAVTVLCQDLLEIAYQRLSKALDADPTHRSAAEQWVFLSLEAAPSKVAEIFPLLLLLTERDPSDENTAVLGLSYIGMGKPGYGKGLLQQARLRTAQPALLAEYMAWK